MNQIFASDNPYGVKMILNNPNRFNYSFPVLLDYLEIYCHSDSRINWGDALCVMVIILGNRHGDTSSNPGQDWLHFTKH